MRRSVTFIHAADLHLGAPFKGLRALSSVWADHLLRAIPEAFSRVIDAAIEESVDFVVIAGDIFDDSRPSYADFSLFVAGMKRLGEAGIPSYIVTGNHDPYVSWRSDFALLPASTHVLGVKEPTFACFERDGQPLALVGGRGYFNQSWPADCDVSEGISRETAISELGIQAPFMVGILHTGLNIDPTRSPVDPRRLMGRGVDYWACGHIHRPMVLPAVDDPRIVFSGCPQGRDIKEDGEHGVFKVTLEEGLPNRVEFIPTAQVAWGSERVDVSECHTVAAIQEKLTALEFERNSHTRCQRMVFRFTLTGRTPLHSELTDRVLDDVRATMNDGYPFFFVDSLVNETAAPLDRASLQEEGLFPSVYLRSSARCRKDSTSLMRDLEREFVERDLSLPKGLADQLPDLCDEAETLVLDLLEPGVRS